MNAFLRWLNVGMAAITSSFMKVNSSIHPFIEAGPSSSNLSQSLLIFPGIPQFQLWTLVLSDSFSSFTSLK
jgi:hypothetical protein